MLFKDAISKENLLKYYVKTESNNLYKKGIEELRLRGYIIKAIVCDGRRGLLQSFGNIPVQMCQFHQTAIIRRYLTRNPKMPSVCELFLNFYQKNKYIKNNFSTLFLTINNTIQNQCNFLINYKHNCSMASIIFVPCKKNHLNYYCK